MSGTLLLVVGVLSLLTALNARTPLQGKQLVMASWFVAFVLSELAVYLVVIGGVFVVLLAALGGALSSTTGDVGLACWAIAVGLVAPDALVSLRTRIEVDGRPDELDLDGAPKLPLRFMLVPLLMWWAPGVRVERGRVFAQHGKKRLKLDIVRPRHDPGRPLPAVVHVHGGIWMFGSRLEQGVPTLAHLARNGFIGFNVDYRLSPRATMPEHVEDVKRAIAWVREHATELGVHPDFIAITGGSAGGHLVALAALTSDDRSLQPGFEDADTSVQAAVPFYGVYDLLDETPGFNPALRDLVETKVVKATSADQPELYRAISPSHRITAAAPPFFVLHGTGDTIVPIEESRRFVAKLRQGSQEPVLYAEMEGGQHSFDSLPTKRSAPAIRAVERFLTATYATRHLDAEAAEDAAEQALT